VEADKLLSTVKEIKKKKPELIYPTYQNYTRTISTNINGKNPS
jgi:hypothetical protein